MKGPNLCSRISEHTRESFLEFTCQGYTKFDFEKMYLKSWENISLKAQQKCRH
uniref:Uncharacterized protein n=1 Tax=Rhizophora mucronata TaxID=61149 RepID=A0A2P2QXM3_RHIMU